MMKKILILTGRYLPGHKDGGPLRTIINLTEALFTEYEFYIACYDRDHGDLKPYENIKYNEWNSVGSARVWYVKEGFFSKKLIQKLALGKDFIYLTGFFEEYGYNTLLLKKTGKIKLPLAIASMGVFAKDALAHGAVKKRLFIGACKALGLFKGIVWSVTSELEATDVKKTIGSNIQYVVAEDLPRIKIPGRFKQADEKIGIVFLSRICEHKHPDIVIDAVSMMHNKQNVSLSFFGPIQEKAFWDKCIQKLERVDYKWNYGGDVPSDNVQEVLSHYDLFVLPSKSENYGHVIYEALSVGCIPVISNRTPWKDLEKENIGYEVQLDAKSFAEKLNLLANMSADERNIMADNCVSYAKRKSEEVFETTGYRKIFGQEDYK